MSFNPDVTVAPGALDANGTPIESVCILQLSDICADYTAVCRTP